MMVVAKDIKHVFKYIMPVLSASLTISLFRYIDFKYLLTMHTSQTCISKLKKKRKKCTFIMGDI